MVAAPPAARPAALVTAPVGLTGAHWIWSAEAEPAPSAPAGTRYLRRTFTAPAGPYTDAQLVVTGDDTVDVWLNDTYLAGSARTPGAWRRARYVDLAAALKPGGNTLTIAARNTAAGPAGVLGRVRVTTAQSTVDLVTDGTWQAASSVPQTWTAARDLGAYGTGPWRRGVLAPDSGAGSPVTPAGLTTDRTYHWRVRVWDAQGRPSPWSAPARFDTGLLDPATEWQAEFIGGPATADLTGAEWIWYPEGDPAVTAPAEQRFFRRTFDLAAVAKATLVVTGDDTADVWVNGPPVSASRRVADSWQRATTVDVTAQLRAGANTIAIAAVNTTAGPASIIAKLTSGTTTVLTGSAWRASQSGPTGWEQPGFDDSGWAAVRVTAASGAGPWGSQVTVPNPTPYLSKGFRVGKPVARARFFATALACTTRISTAPRSLPSGSRRGGPTTTTACSTAPTT